MAPVGGTMWAASPARNSRPKRIGSATKERRGAIDFSNEGPVTTASATSRRQAAAELVPEGVVGPVLDLVGQRHLEVVAAARRRAHRAEREAARVLARRQLVARRAAPRRAGRASRRDRPARRSAIAFGGTALRLAPWKPSQPMMKSRVDAVGRAVLLVGDPRMRAVEVARRHLLRRRRSSAPRRASRLSIRSRVTSVWP